MSDWTPAVGDYVRYHNQHMTWRIEEVRQVVFILRSGGSGRRAWARREDFELFQKHEEKEAA